MHLRDSRIVPIVGWLVSCLLALSALAWSAHIDWQQASAASAQGPQSQMTLDEMSVSDDRQSPEQTPGDNSDLDAGTGNHDDSCDHASSHLLALGSDLAGTPLAGAGNAHAHGHRDYQGLAYAPLIEPPIA